MSERNDWTEAELAAMAKRRPQPEPEEPVEAMQMVEDEYAEPEPEPVAPVPATAWEIYLSMLTDEQRELLSEDDLREDFENAEREAKEERRKVLRQQARDRAKAQARASAGLLTPEKVEQLKVAERNNKRVKVTIQLPFVSDTGGVVAEGVTIDGVTYVHGQSYTMPYGRALDIRKALYSLQQNELDFEGKGRLHALRRQHASGVNMVRMG